MFIVRFRRTAAGVFLGLAFLAACAADGTSASSGDVSDGLLATKSSALAATPGWFGTATMGLARAQHASVLLPSGKLLVVNGINRNGFLQTADLYDPTTDTWSSAGTSGIQGNVTLAVLLPSGKVLVLTDGSATGRVYDSTSGSWSATGAMSTTRSLPTLTLLASGKVLVVGGTGEAGARLASAELYDPSSNAFTLTGSMGAGRSAHVATRLANGKVLVTSGFDQGGEVASAELYDPAAGTWSAAAPPLIARHYATSTLLPDGRVLVAGGFGNVGSLVQAELYDPTSNTWTATGSLAAARAGHSATLLPNGKVLITGGSVFRQAAQTVAELYDPATGTWASAGTMITGRENHTATLLPTGKVFVSGGYTEAPSLAYYASTEVYDPAVNAWSAGGTLATPRSRSVSTLLPSGKVLVAGGRNAGGTTVATSELYDRASNAWSAAASLSTARERGTATLLPSGKVLVVGGTTGAGTVSLATTEQYDPVAGTWSAGAALANARHLHSSTLLPNGKLLVVGGLKNTAPTASAELFDPSANTWSPAAALATARSEHAAVLLANGKLLVAGGRSSAGGALASAEVFDPVANTWSAAAPLANARQGFTLSLLPSGKVLASGGVTGTTGVLPSEIYDPATNSWTGGGNLNQARWGHTATLMASGEILLAGGSSGATNADTADVYDPTLHAWRGVASPAVVGEVVATSLPSGQVLLAGGTAATTAQLYDDTATKAAWRPVVTTPDTLFAGCPGVIEGQLFRGISGGGSGGYQDSSTDFPLVRLQAADGERLWTLPTTASSSTGVTANVPADLPVGFYSLSVLANAISGGRMTKVVANTAPSAADKAVATTVDVPLPIVVTATDADLGQTLTYAVVTPPAHGTLSGDLPSVTYTPNPGFAGADSFTFTARDCSTDSNVATVAITVVDPPPNITCPANVEVEATSAAGAPANWPPAIATDGAGPAPTITYAPAEGSTLPLGSTTVTATAEDAAGNETSCVFQVVVEDTTAPTLSCPKSRTVRASPSSSEEVVSFDLPEAKDAVSSVTVTSSPASGSRFALGKTTVTVTAKDAAGNTATCTFDVTVEAATPTTSGDAGDEEADGGDGLDDGHAASSDGCGCKLTGRRVATSPGGVVLALAAASAIVRLRRRRSPFSAR